MRRRRRPATAGGADAPGWRHAGPGPGRRSLVAVLRSWPAARRVRRLGRLRRRGGEGHAHDGLLVLDDTDDPSRVRRQPGGRRWTRRRSTTRSRASTAAPRSRSCSSSGCASTTSTRGDALVDARRGRGVPGRPVAGPRSTDIAAVTGRWQAAGPRPRPVGRRRPGGRRGPDPQGPGVRPAAVRAASRVPCPPTSSPRSPRASGRRWPPRGSTSTSPRSSTSSRPAPRPATPRSAPSAGSTAARPRRSPRRPGRSSAGWPTPGSPRRSSTSPAWAG